MNTLNAEEHKSAHCETWPATVVLHSNQAIWSSGQDYSSDSTADLAHSMKAVFVPHPVHILSEHSSAQISSVMSRQNFYMKGHEKLVQGASFYGMHCFGKEIYMSWKAKDRSCMAPALLNPIKGVT
jgi:hypothetical protein